jgi:glycosyltransferase involved in cell wall biosynthesis
MIPRVSVGLPVYNGERFLRDAIESVLAQTFTDFELVISDNASTDGTAAIAAEFATGDDRVRHLRHEATRGARWNFNRVFDECRGNYFVWLAHDDSWEPEFLERCVGALDSDPGVVLAFSDVVYVDEHSSVVGSRPLSMRTDSHRAHHRLWDLLMVWHDCLPIFGVVRADVLRSTPLIGPYASGDHLLLAQLGLTGRFAIVDRPLFRSRAHSGQSIQTFNVWVDHHAYSEWFEASEPGRLRFPQWRLFADLLSSVWRAPIGMIERARCMPAVVRWCVRYRTLFVKDLTLAFHSWRRRRAAESVAGAERPCAEPRSVDTTE